MAFVNGKTYRFINAYYKNYALNVYGTNAASTGRNVCLFKDTPSDIMQKWVVKSSGTGYRLHSSVNESFVLDRSDGSLSNSYLNNAHLCDTNYTSTADSQVEFVKVSDNVYRIYLPAHGLYLTATNTNVNANGLPASSISTSTALTGGTGGESNVYWAARSSSTKQQWRVEPEVDGGTDPDPGDDGDDIIIDEPAGVYFSQQTYNWSRPSVISVSNFRNYGCAAVAATMFARIMMKDASITPEDMYDEGVWTVDGKYPYATWNTANSDKLDFNFIGPISGWSTNAAPLIYDEIHANRPVIIWVHGQSGGNNLDTHFVVGYGLKAGATKNNLKYDQVLVHDPWTYENKTLQDTMNAKAEWSIFGTIRYARAK